MGCANCRRRESRQTRHAHVGSQSRVRIRTSKKILKHYASSKFWALYSALPLEVRVVADKNYQLLRADPHHPSLHFKRIGRLWSVRAGLHHRALGIGIEDGVMWIWICTHAEYDKLV